MFLILRTGSGVGFEVGDHDNRLSLESSDEIVVGPHQWRHHQREPLLGDCEFQNGFARTRSDADASTHKKGASRHVDASDEANADG